MRQALTIRPLAILGVLLTLSSIVGAQETTRRESESFRAFAVSLGGFMVGGRGIPSGTATVDITVDRTSTDAERGMLLDVLRESGPGQLAAKLGKMDPVGKIQVRGRLAWDLRYARELSTEDGGRVLILATDRWVHIQEVLNNAPSRDYDISVIELVLDADGNGAGTVLAAVDVGFDETKGDITLARLGTSPIQLTKVRRTE